MPTKLTKPVTREIELPLDNRAAKPVNVTIFPDGTIRFHPKGTQQKYDYPLSNVYSRAVMADGVARAKEAKRLKALK